MVLLSKSTRCFEIFLDAEPQRGYTQLELNLCYEIGGMNWFHGEVTDVSPSFQLRESAERVAKERNSTVKEIKPS